MGIRANLGPTAQKYTKITRKTAEEQLKVNQNYSKNSQKVEQKSHLGCIPADIVYFCIDRPIHAFNLHLVPLPIWVVAFDFTWLAVELRCASEARENHAAVWTSVVLQAVWPRPCHTQRLTEYLSSQTVRAEAEDSSFLMQNSTFRIYKLIIFNARFMIFYLKNGSKSASRSSGGVNSHPR